MRKGKSLLGLLVVCAVALCAFGASSASAYTAHECRSVTGTGTKYTDSTCGVESTSGTFQTVPVSEGTAITATITKNAALGTETFRLKSINAGVIFTISCTSITSEGAKVTNKAGEKEMFVEGSGKVIFSGCTVTEPAGKGCVVKSAGKASGTIATGELTVKSDSAGSLEYKPVAQPFVTIEVSGCSSTALNGPKEVTGSAKSKRVSAPTQEFTEGSGSELKFGGQNATFIGAYHFKGPNGGTIGLELP